MVTVREYRPDAAYFQNRANYIARNSGRPIAEIERIEINCGSGGCSGWVVLKTGERIEV